MRAAKEPFGGGLDETGAAFAAAGFGALAVAGDGLGTVGLFTAGFATVGFVGAGLADGAVLVDIVPLL
jgi:hypothetical protein